MRLIQGAILAAATRASADVQAPEAIDPTPCVKAFHDTQRLMRSGDLLEAHKQVVVCGSSACPATLARECIQWLRQVEEDTPTVVLEARDARGMDVTGVRVFCDGKPIAVRLDGHAIAVNPGLHTFRFIDNRNQTIEAQVIVRQGEKNRRITVTLSSPPLQSTARVAPPTPRTESRSTKAEFPSAVLWLGAGGVLGAASFGYFAWDAHTDLEAMRSGCAPNCEEADVDRARHKAWIADTSLGVGVLCFGIAGWMLLDKPEGAGAIEVRATTQGLQLQGAF